MPLFNMRHTIREEEFSDSHHLLPDGATQFTRDLAGRLEPLLRRLASSSGPEAAP